MTDFPASVRSTSRVLNAYVREKRDLAGIACHESFQELLQSNEIQNGVNHLRSDSFSARDSAAVYNDDRVLSLAQTDRWAFRLSCGVRKPRYIQSVPCETVLVCIAQASPEAPSLDIHNIVGPIDDLSLALAIHLEKTHACTLPEGRAIHLHAGRTAIKFAQRSRGDVFLTLSSTDCEDYILLFDTEDSKLTSASYSDATASSEQFFADLVREAAKSDQHKRLIPDNTEGLASLIEARINDVRLPAEVRWSYAQALGHVAPARLVSALCVLRDTTPNQAIHTLCNKYITLVQEGCHAS